MVLGLDREGRGTHQAPVSERGYAMLLAQLALVAGGVGTEAYDSVFNDQVCVCVCVCACVRPALQVAEVLFFERWAQPSICPSSRARRGASNSWRCRLICCAASCS